MGMAHGTPGEWDRYVKRFHSRRPGVTEALLRRSVDGDNRTAYDWITDGLPSGVALDVGCGSGPTKMFVPHWIGVDRSRDELEVARRRNRGPLVAASASALPLRQHSVEVVLASMSLMVIHEAGNAITEIARVLRPGGELRALLPSDGPLSTIDRIRYALLLIALGLRSMPFPRSDISASPGRALSAPGFEMASDDRRRFRFRFGTSEDADLFIESLYLPEVSQRRYRLGRALVRSWGRGGIGIPLRRVTARLR